MVSDQHGTWLAHWLIRRSGSGFYYDTYLSHSTDQGNTWSPPIKLHSDDTDSEHGFVSIASNAPGIFDIVWLDGRQFAQALAEPKMEFRHKRWAHGNLSEASIIDPDVCTCCDTSALYFNDELWVAYRGHNDQERRDIFVSKMSANGQIEPVIVTEDQWTIASCPVNGPALSMVNKAPALAWFTEADGLRRVHFKHLTKEAESLHTFAVGHSVGRVDLAAWDDGVTALSHLIKTDAYEGLSIEWIHSSGELLRKDVIATISAGRRTGFPKIFRVDEYLWLVWTETSSNGTSLRGAKLPRPEV